MQSTITSGRRNFITLASLAAAGAALGESNTIFTSQAPSDAKTDVLDIVSKYGTPCQISGDQGNTRGVSIKVKMHSHAAFARTFNGEAGLPFEKIHAAGNILRFQHRGVEFALENLI